MEEDTSCQIVECCVAMAQVVLCSLECRRIATGDIDP